MKTKKITLTEIQKLINEEIEKQIKVIKLLKKKKLLENEIKNLNEFRYEDEDFNYEKVEEDPFADENEQENK